MKVLKNNQIFLSFLGFLGFKSLYYFQTKDVSDLYYLMYFSFFGYFFTSKINRSINDELYEENNKIAKAFSFDLCIILVSIFTIASLFIYIDTAIVFRILFVVLVLSYSIKFYILEK